MNINDLIQNKNNIGLYIMNKFINILKMKGVNMYKLKKDITPIEREHGGYDIIFWDSKKDDAVNDYFMPKGTLGYLVNQGKTNGKRHLTFWFADETMENKSIEFFGWKHLKEYVEPIGDYYEQIVKHGKILYH
tara:strand:+ start:402 stop:800 length:399 start_codon:yes stop_codon:yes gene_type:complete